MLASDKAMDGTPIALLTKGSIKRVALICDDCGKRSETNWNNYVQGQRKQGWTGETFCQPCVARRIGKSSRGTTNKAVAERNRQRTRENHPCWKGGRYVDHHGYVMVNVVPGRQGSGSGWVNYRKEHVVVMEGALGRTLLPTEVVHHIDGDKTNNAPENLWLTDRTRHRQAHSSLQGVAFRLLRSGFLMFNRETGTYECKDRQDDS